MTQWPTHRVKRRKAGEKRRYLKRQRRLNRKVN